MCSFWFSRWLKPSPLLPLIALPNVVAMGKAPRSLCCGWPNGTVRNRTRVPAPKVGTPLGWLLHVLVTGKKYSKTGIRQGFAKYMVKNPCVSERPYKLAVRIFEYFLPGTSMIPVLLDLKKGQLYANYWPRDMSTVAVGYSKSRRCLILRRDTAKDNFLSTIDFNIHI